jgi:hypothetical protein
LRGGGHRRVCAVGLIEAARKRLDAVGVCVVAGLAAFGGGTLRDVLLDRRPFFWVQHAHWLWALLALCVAAMLSLQNHRDALAHADAHGAQRVAPARPPCAAGSPRWWPGARRWRPAGGPARWRRRWG